MGGLYFDNGMCGAVLIHGYALTGERRYLDAAVRAGRWARPRLYSPNFNYKGFSGLLFARLYRATGDRESLDAARDVFEFGVLAGQLPNGRWFDQHNAKIQYHAILCAQVAEYLLALRFAQDPSVGRVEQSLRGGLDNLAEEIVRYGTNNAEEALSLLALSFGSRVLEPGPIWTKATTIAVNYVTGPLAERLRSGGGGLPEPVAAWVLWSRPSDQGRETVELRSPLPPRSSSLLIAAFRNAHAEGEPSWMNLPPFSHGGSPPAATAICSHPTAASVASQDLMKDLSSWTVECVVVCSSSSSQNRGTVNFNLGGIRQSKSGCQNGVRDKGVFVTAFIDLIWKRAARLRWKEMRRGG